MAECQLGAGRKAEIGDATPRRTVDRILAAMPAENRRLTNQPAFYVGISRARDTAVLVADDAHKLAEQLERATIT